jgi:outer membrane protein OmpA-like peptidoglycan-associated protein
MHTMRLIIVLCLLGWAGMQAGAQNLLVNGDFEEENICTEYGKNCAPEGWIVSSLQSQFYFDDEKNAYAGKHFLGLVAGRNGRYNTRNFVSSQLLCGLRPGAYYRLRLFARKGFADSVGIAFTADDPLFRKTGLKGIQPVLLLSDSLSETAHPRWQRFEARFQATGRETFLVLANFQHRPADFVPATRADFDLYLDSISLLPLDPMEVLCDGALNTKELLYAMDERHDLLDRKIYQYQRRPPAPTVLQRTIRLRIDTLVIPDIFFATNSFALSPRARNLLDSFVRRITGVQADSLVVEGHTDSRGSRQLNEELSVNRAEAVIRELAGGMGGELPIPTRKRGWADVRPVADNNTPEGRQRNRRVEIYLYARD